MSKLRVCDGCSRHVFVSELACPFCGLQLSAAGASVEPKLSGGMSRAQRFAAVAAVAGQTLIASCSSHDQKGGESGTNAAGSGSAGQAGTASQAGAAGSSGAAGSGQGGVSGSGGIGVAGTSAGAGGGGGFAMPVYGAPFPLDGGSLPIYGGPPAPLDAGEADGGDKDAGGGKFHPVYGAPPAPIPKK